MLGKWVSAAQEVERQFEAQSERSPAQCLQDDARRFQIISSIDQAYRNVNDCAETADNAISMFFFGLETKYSPNGITMNKPWRVEKQLTESIILRKASQSYRGTLQVLQDSANRIRNNLGAMR